VAYANIKLAITLDIDGNSALTRSDVYTSSIFYNRGLVSHSLIQNDSAFQNWHSGLLDHVYVIANASFSVYGEMRASRQVGPSETYAGSDSVISQSVLDYLRGSGNTQSSIINKYIGSNDPYSIIDSDVALYSFGATWNSLFDGSYMTILNGSSFYDGLGTPNDTIGDGVAETEFILSGQTYKVDGIKNPRSTPNFPNGESDLWDPNGVGVLWDKNDPNTFPDPLAP